MDAQGQQQMRKALDELKRGGSPLRGQTKNIKIGSNGAKFVIEHRALGERAGGIAVSFIDATGRHVALGMESYGAPTGTTSNQQKAWEKVVATVTRRVSGLIGTQIFG